MSALASAIELLPGLPDSIQVETVQTGGGLASALFLSHAAGQSRETVPLGPIPQMAACLALHRFNPWSLYPIAARDLSSLPDELVFLLWHRQDGGYGVLIPLADGGARHSLGGCAAGLAVHRMPWDRPEGACRMVFAATGPDPFSLVEASVSLLARRLRTFRPRWEKPVPRWIDRLGWCTWDAFYREVSEAGVIDGLEAARAAGVPLGFIMLDDGWQDTDDRQLVSFGAHPAKFPHGLASLIQRAKTDYGIRMFGVWHAFQGYWYGLLPDSPAGRSYDLIRTLQTAHNRTEDDPAERALVHPDAVHRFYHDYHRVLRAAGVDLVKVDNQGSLDHFLSPDTAAPTPTMARYQEALQGAAQFCFHGETLHCLSQCTDVLFNLEAANVMRNSEDYFPARPETQGKHVFANALNNVFMQAFCVPDWDMFQSGNPLGAFHAAARAISGGPVYVSDKPGRWDADLIRKLVYSDGAILRCPQPALPTPDCLFKDCHSQPHLLKIQNRTAHAGVLGIFNCFQGPGAPQTIGGSFAVSEIRGLPGGAFAVFFNRSRSAKLCAPGDEHPLALQALDWELVTAVPLANGVAVFGLIDKLNGSAAVQDQHWEGPDTLEIRLREGGPCAFFSLRPPSAVIANGVRLPFRREADSLWVAEVPVQSNIRVRIRLDAASERVAPIGFDRAPAAG